MLKPTIVALSLAVMTSTGHAQDVRRNLTEVAPDIWRFDNNFHVSMVVVTEDGAVVTDPINAEAASWLETEIANRFGKDVTYMLPSHSHADHGSGGEVFADTATIIAHENYQKAVGQDFGPTHPADVLFSDKAKIYFLWMDVYGVSPNFIKVLPQKEFSLVKSDAYDPYDPY